MIHQPDPANPDAFIKVNIKFTLGFAAISFFLAVIVTVVYSSNADKVKRENIAFFAAATATAIAATSAFYALQSIRQNNKVQQETKKLEEETRKSEAEILKGNWKREADEKKMERTLMFIRRWNDPQFSSNRQAISEMLDSVEHLPEQQQPNAMKKELESNAGNKQAAINILNFLEEMCICIEKGILDEDFLYEFYRLIVFRCCKVFSLFITERRNKTGSDRVYRSLMDLADKWRQRNGT